MGSPRGIIMDILYRDFGAARYASTDERFANGSAFSPHTQIGQPLAVLTDAVKQRRYQATPENGLTTNWYVKMNIDSARDNKWWSTIKVPAGEKLCLYKHLPGWNRLIDLGVLVGCGTEGLTADISVVACSDIETPVVDVATGQALDAPTDFAFDIAPPNGIYINREDSFLLKVCIEPPYTDADGNGVFVKGAGTECEARSCVKLIVHAHLRNMCFSETLRGCRLEDYGCDCCSEEYVDPCADEKEEKAAE